jgi:hypothetical protein
MFAAGGNVQKSILLFLEAVEDCLTTPAGSGGSGSSGGSGGYTQRDAVNSVVKDLFETFDVDNDGHIETVRRHFS